jgi:hypothetical protein
MGSKMKGTDNFDELRALLREVDPQITRTKENAIVKIVEDAIEEILAEHNVRRPYRPQMR